jgi:hypothetical protein
MNTEKKPFDWAGAIIVSALLVNIPRLIVYALKADGISLWAEIEALLIGVSGIGTGVVFSGGQLMIAHTIPTLQDGGYKNIIIAIWGAMLVFSVIIISPFMVAGILAQPDLKVVLAEWWQVWLWAITSIAAAEIVAAGVMLARSLPKKSGQKRAVPTRGQKGNSGQQGLASAPRVRVMRPYDAQLGGYRGQLSAENPAQNGVDKVDRQRSILDYYLSNPSAGQRSVQSALGIPKSTVGKDLLEMEASGAVDRTDGTVRVLIDPSAWGRS